MSTPNSWPGSSGLVTASPATAVKAVRWALPTRRCMSPSTTPHAWPMSWCFRTSRRARLSASWLGLSTGSASRASPAGTSSQTTALPADQELGERPEDPRSQADPHQAVYAPHQRQGRAVHPDPLPGMGLWDANADLRGAEAMASSLPGAQ